MCDSRKDQQHHVRLSVSPSFCPPNVQLFWFFLPLQLIGGVTAQGGAVGQAWLSRCVSSAPLTFLKAHNYLSVTQKQKRCPSRQFIKFVAVTFGHIFYNILFVFSGLGWFQSNRCVWV